jgi:hypothetical protein
MSVVEGMVVVRVYVAPRTPGGPLPAAADVHEYLRWELEDALKDENDLDTQTAQDALEFFQRYRVVRVELTRADLAEADPYPDRACGTCDARLVWRAGSYRHAGPMLERHGADPADVWDQEEAEPPAAETERVTADALRPGDLVVSSGPGTFTEGPGLVLSKTPHRRGGRQVGWRVTFDRYGAATWRGHRTVTIRSRAEAEAPQVRTYDRQGEPHDEVLRTATGRAVGT